MQRIFFILLFALYALSPDYISTNQHSRFNLTKAIVLDASFQIDRFVSNTTDWASYNGHFYTNKAPGVSLLAAVPYTLVTLVSKNDRINLIFCDLIVTALPSVLLCMLLLRFLSERYPERGNKSPWFAVLAFAVGTIFFPFSTNLWGHPTSAAFLFASYYFLTLRKRPELAGFFFGMAVLTEYSVVTAILGLLFLLYREKTGSIRFALGGLPALALFMFYHWACFDSPLRLPASYENPVLALSATPKLFGVLTLPSLTVLYKLLFSEERGLFVLSPILLLAPLGFYHWIKIRKHRIDALVALWIVVGMLLFNSAYQGWHGGWSAGPRYLIPCLPFLAMALVWVKQRFLFHALLVVSAVNMAAISAVTLFTEPGHSILRRFIYPGLTQMHRWPVFILILSAIGALYVLAYRASLERARQR